MFMSSSLSSPDLNQALFVYLAYDAGSTHSLQSVHRRNASIVSLDGSVTHASTPAGNPDVSTIDSTCSSSGRLMSMSGSPSSPQGSDSRRRDTIWDTSMGRLVASPDSVNSSRCCRQPQPVSDEGHKA